MTRAEQISDALTLLDDDLIEAAEAARSGRTRSRGRLRRWAALAACFCLIAGLAAALYVLPIGGKCAGNIGVLLEGLYYYQTDYGIYVHNPETGEQTKLQTTLRAGWTVDEGGLYTTSGRSLYLQPHGSKTKTLLYRADWSGTRSVELLALEDGLVTLRLRSRKDNGLGDQVLVQIDGTGEVLWRQTLSRDDMLAYGRTDYPLGEHRYQQVRTENSVLLYRDGAPFLPEGARLERDPRYIGDNLLIRYQIGRRQYCMLALPNGSTKELPSCEVLAGTNQFLLTIEAYDGDPYDLYRYDIESGESILLRADMDIYTATTDGVWLYTSVPWSSRTDCWRLLYNDEGKLTGLELHQSDL